nr:hypothetical protein Iba_chr01aCG14390 [Ipomoea batatas]
MLDWILTIFRTWSVVCLSYSHISLTCWRKVLVFLALCLYCSLEL